MLTRLEQEQQDEALLDLHDAGVPLPLDTATRLMGKGFILERSTHREQED